MTAKRESNLVGIHDAKLKKIQSRNDADANLTEKKQRSDNSRSKNNPTETRHNNNSRCRNNLIAQSNLVTIHCLIVRSNHITH